jgi:hypothetical protein
MRLCLWISLSVAFALPGREVFDSGPMNETSAARQISLEVSEVKRLVLWADPGPDGSFADHAD